MKTLRALFGTLLVPVCLSIACTWAAPPVRAASIENGLLTERPRVIRTTVFAVDPAPAPAPLSTLINFDEVTAPCAFAQTNPLRTEYQALGVTFSGPGPLDGGAVLNQCGNFGVFGHSPPNFLAFNVSALMLNGGVPRGPERLTFAGNVSALQIGMAAGSGGTATLRAFNAASVQVGSVTQPLSNVLSYWTINAPGIRSAEIVVTGALYWICENLSFDLTPCDSGNAAPAFVPPTPACGSLVVGNVGAFPGFPIEASDPDSGDVLELRVEGLPSGATLTPPLPASGNVVHTDFSWTPTLADAGDHLVTFVATDGCSAQSRCSLTLRVETNHPPDCQGALASVRELWPPDHKLVPVAIEGVTDPDGDPVTVTVTGVMQDEPLDGRGDGGTCPDAVIDGGGVQVRRERAGTPQAPGNGRVYTIAFTAGDGRGGSCGGAVTVCVPHDQTPGRFCVDDRLAVNSLGPCRGPAAAASAHVREAGLRLLGFEGRTAWIEYALPEEGDVLLAVYDLAGRQVGTIARARQGPGLHQARWESRGLARGLYFFRLRAGGTVVTKPVLVLE